MLSELILDLKADSPNFGYYQSSNLQGVLMEWIDGAYADVLHEQQRHAYSQCLLWEEARWRWHIRTINREANERIIQPILSQNILAFEIKKKTNPIKITVLGRAYQEVPKKRLMEAFYQDHYDRYLNIAFQSGTAFKQNGRYQIFPDVRLIFQSLMQKYSAASDTYDMTDEETLQELCRKSEIVKYRLKSVAFPIEGMIIPAFMGRLTIKVGGAPTLAKYARMLAQFGAFSGIGVKSAMGMGAMQLMERRRDKHE
jgi:CRISPR-associated endoribonuclease Cas6